MCTPIKTSQDVDNLIEWYSEILINMAMVNYPYPTSFLAPLPAFPVRNFCFRLTGETITDDKSLVTAIGKSLELYTNFTGSTKCNNINQTAQSVGENVWDFQACTEMIMPMCSDDNDMFENGAWDFKKFSDDCFKKWGVRQTNPELPILEYGGKDIGAASNIVFSNGLLDPWSSGGVLSNISSSVSSVIISEGAHHLDLREENKNDPKSVIEARKFHVNSIRKWITDFYFSRDKDYFKKASVFSRITYSHRNNV